ncbi:hypothetical protein [Nocardia sp. NPDC059228]|uniref:hypothetical protein n=1 Tax=Nocardia sp. NPDC059228 TaxID=3346777 RepID=UPI0036C16C58
MTVRVVNAARDGIQDTERQVIAALQAWNVPGIAVSGAKVPVSGGGSAESDLLVILPHLAVAVEVKGLVKRLGGRLYCPVQGDWSLPGIVGDPVHTQAGGNPREQVERVMYGFKNFAEGITEAKRGLFVDALVLVVPWPGRPITLDKGQIPMPPGQDVMVFDAGLGQLRGWADRSAARRDVAWSVARVSKVLEALGFGYANHNPDKRVTYAELTAAGFPITTSTPAPAPATPEPPAPQAPAATAVPAAAERVTPDPWQYTRRPATEPDDDPATEPEPEVEPEPESEPYVSSYSGSSRSTTEPGRWYQPATPQPAQYAPETVAFGPPEASQRPKRRQGGQWALAAGIAALWLILVGAAGALIPVHPRVPAITPAENQPTQPALSTAAAPPPAFSAPTRTHWTPPPCYPMQTGC